MTTVIAFDLPEPGLVTLRVFNVSGRMVMSLTDQVWPAGRHSATWTGEDATGNTVGPGIYFVRIEAGDFTDTKKMIILR